MVYSSTDVDAAVPSAPGSDATAAQTCFGSSILRICLAQPPTESFTASNMFDTSDVQRCAQPIGGSPYCVVAATTISVATATTLRVTGPRPLVLLASDTIDVSGTIDVTSRRSGTMSSPGAGEETDSGVCQTGSSPGTAELTMQSGGNGIAIGGGGAGGNFMHIGGAGGHGTNLSTSGSSTGGNNGTDAPPTSVTTLRGGCAGQPGAAGKTGGGDFGHGGGAVFLIAGTSITVDGSILAGGEGGGGATNNGQASGGGGGGAGGMIGFDAPIITIGQASHIAATGGGGGQGADAGTTSGSGAPGADGTSTAAAPGGANAIESAGGRGGAGSNTQAAGHIGSDGTITMSIGGGGGGGGGPGLILAPGNTVFMDVAPQPIDPSTTN